MFHWAYMRCWWSGGKSEINMPVCALCDGESFGCIDGLYYCQNCGTQSQDIRDEQLADDEVVDSRLQVAKQRKRGPTKQFFADKGKPWFMYEAFQCIIKAQVECLINLGVDPALKDVVFKLWYKYLQVTGTAFTGSLEGTVPTKGSIFYCRHAKLLDMNKRKHGGRKNKVDSDEENDDELELCSHFSDEEFSEGDDPSKVPSKDSNDADDINLGDDFTAFSKKQKKTTEDIPSCEDSSDSSEDEFVGSLTLNQPKRTKVESGHVTLQSTLAFCYLGLLWINEPVFVSDLVRWAKQGQLPYFQATRHIPHHMKFGQGDFSCLCPLGVPPVSKLLTLATQIARLLQLPQFPEPKWSTYTARFITDLHLPGFLHGVVRKLTEKVKINMKIHPTSDQPWCSAIPNLEAGAMAFIVVGLKLYYGIDDRTEKKQEELASPTEPGPTSAVHDTIPLFTDWLKSWKHCEAKRFENGVPWTDEQFKLVRDPTAYSAFCKSDIFGSWEPSDRVYTGSHQKNLRANRITNEESQEKYAQLFKSLMTREREEDFNNTATPKITSFPATCVHVADADNKPAPCFDKTRTREIKTEKIFGDPFQKDNDLKYIKYPANCADQNSFHSSYKTLLTILADRIEMKPMDLQAKVNKLENALLFGQSLLYGVL